jgi:hypothetical protein
MFSQEPISMFASDLAFSKAIMADRTYRPPHPRVERVYRIEAERPAPRAKAGGR